MQLKKTQTINFQKFIWDFYRTQGRPFAWRNSDNPYHIVVSEIMLQQTQTYRVEPKFEQFLGAFTTWHSLASAPLRDVLAVWQGLGYNRRGIALHNIAKKVVNEFNGQLPDDPEVLVNFPGIGKATAGSICAFAFNKPTVFIETNIRAVLIYCFFNDQENVHDNDLMPLIATTVDQDNPREWYYALMDYGVFLKKQFKNPSRKSKHHTKQSKFEGSDRQIRGNILKLLIKYEALEKKALIQQLAKEPQRVEKILGDLVKESFIVQVSEHYHILNN